MSNPFLKRGDPEAAALPGGVPAYEFTPIEKLDRAPPRTPTAAGLEEKNGVMVRTYFEEVAEPTRDGIRIVGRRKVYEPPNRMRLLDDLTKMERQAYIDLNSGRIEQGRAALQNVESWLNTGGNRRMFAEYATSKSDDPMMQRASTAASELMKERWVRDPEVLKLMSPETNPAARTRMIMMNGVPPGTALARDMDAAYQSGGAVDVFTPYLSGAGGQAPGGGSAAQSRDTLAAPPALAVPPHVAYDVALSLSSLINPDRDKSLQIGELAGTAREVAAMGPRGRAAMMASTSSEAVRGLAPREKAERVAADIRGISALVSVAARRNLPDGGSLVDPSMRDSIIDAAQILAKKFPGEGLSGAVPYISGVLSRGDAGLASLYGAKVTGETIAGLAVPLLASRGAAPDDRGAASDDREGTVLRIADMIQSLDVYPTADAMEAGLAKTGAGGSAEGGGAAPVEPSGYEMPLVGIRRALTLMQILAANGETNVDALAQAASRPLAEVYVGLNDKDANDLAKAVLTEMFATEDQSGVNRGNIVEIHDRLRLREGETKLRTGGVLAEGNPADGGLVGGGPVGGAVSKPGAWDEVIRRSPPFAVAQFRRERDAAVSGGKGQIWDTGSAKQNYPGMGDVIDAVAEEGLSIGATVARVLRSADTRPDLRRGAGPINRIVRPIEDAVMNASVTRNALGGSADALVYKLLQTVTFSDVVEERKGQRVAHLETLVNTLGAALTKDKTIDWAMKANPDTWRKMISRFFYHLTSGIAEELPGQEEALRLSGGAGDTPIAEAFTPSRFQEYILPIVKRESQRHMKDVARFVALTIASHTLPDPKAAGVDSRAILAPEWIQPHASIQEAPTGFIPRARKLAEQFEVQPGSVQNATPAAPPVQPPVVTEVPSAAARDAADRLGTTPDRIQKLAETAHRAMSRREDAAELARLFQPASELAMQAYRGGYVDDFVSDQAVVLDRWRRNALKAKDATQYMTARSFEHQRARAAAIQAATEERGIRRLRRELELRREFAPKTGADGAFLDAANGRADAPADEQAAGAAGTD